MWNHPNADCFYNRNERCYKADLAKAEALSYYVLFYCCVSAGCGHQAAQKMTATSRRCAAFWTALLRGADVASAVSLIIGSGGIK